jgi:hypothetical protein
MAFDQTAGLAALAMAQFLPGSPQNPYFDGSNASDFIDRFEDITSAVFMIQDEETKKTRFVKNCSSLIRDRVKMLAVAYGSWDDFKNAVLDAYYDLDATAVTKTRAYLEKLCETRRTTNAAALTFCHEFAGIAAGIPADELDKVTKGRLFLSAIPESMSKKVFTQCCVRNGKAVWPDFVEIYQAVVKLLAGDKLYASQMSIASPEVESQVKEVMAARERVKPTFKPIAQELTTPWQAAAVPPVNEREVAKLTKRLQDLEIRYGALHYPGEETSRFASVNPPHGNVRRDEGVEEYVNVNFGQPQQYGSSLGHSPYGRGPGQGY